jgi:cytoskeletal protein CcmA (bactofilin family)
MELFSKEPDNIKSQEIVKPAPPISIAAQGAQPSYDVSMPLRGSVRGARPGEASAYLDKDAKISGKLQFQGSVRIDGEVDGEISANDTVVIGEASAVTAQLRAPYIVIIGKITGEVIAAKRLEIHPGAKVFGNLTTPVLVVHDGALLEGHCTMNPGAKEDGKVTPPVPKEEHALPQSATGKLA